MPAQDNTDKALRCYYLFVNEDGILTAQLSNEPMQDCIAKTLEAFRELSARQVQAARLDELNWVLDNTMPNHVTDVPEIVDRIKQLQAAAPTTAEGK